MNISLFSAIALYLNSAIAFFIVKGKAGRNLSLVLFSMGSFSFFIYAEYHTQTISLLEIASIEKLQLVKLFSTFAGFFVMYGLYRFLIFSIEFPPITVLSKSFLIILRFLSIVISSTSYFGIVISEREGKIIRESTGFMYLHLTFYCATGLTGTFLLFSKSIQHSSLLRKFQITYIPLGLIIALVIGGIFGFLFFDNPVMVSFASFAPLFFSFVMLAGFLFSREIFSRNFDQIAILNKIRKLKRAKDILKLLHSDYSIHLSIRVKREGNHFEDFISSDAAHSIPDSILAISKKEIKYFFIEDYDEYPDSTEFQFRACPKTVI